MLYQYRIEIKILILHITNNAAATGDYITMYCCCIESTVCSFFNRCVCFFSDPQAAAVDALSQPWSKLPLRAFPPFTLIGRYLQKVQEEKLDHLLLIAPVWLSQSWYPLLMEMLVEIPRVLSQQLDILLNPQGELHPLVM